MYKPKKILFVIPSLVAGGAERIISFLAQNLDRETFSPTLLVIGKQKDTAYQVSGIEVIYLEKDRVLQGVVPMFKYIRRHKPELVVTAISHLNAVAGILAMFFPKVKFIAREVNVLSVAKQYKKPVSPVIGFASKIGYKFIDAFVCQSKDMQNDFLAQNRIPKERVFLINNPITDGFELRERATMKKDDTIKFITVASLKKQKGHLRILHALSKFDAPFNYTIVGNGSEKETILQCVKDLKLEDRVNHVPFTEEVPKYLSTHDVFLQGSYVEGFPNCLLESCSVGTPVVAFNAPGGLDEIIEQGINGFIAENEIDFIAFLHKCKNGYPWDYKKINETVTSKFAKEKILNKYETLFLSVLE